MFTPRDNPRSDLVLGCHLIPKHPLLLEPENLSALTAPTALDKNAHSAGLQVPRDSLEADERESANFGLKELKETDE